MLFASGTGRESHQCKPGCYCSEEEQRSQLKRFRDGYSMYWFSPRRSPRSDVQLAERGLRHSQYCFDVVFEMSLMSILKRVGARVVHCETPLWNRLEWLT